MGENPPKPNITRIVLSGAVIGALGIGLFLGSWILLGNLGVDDLARIVVSVCLPPGILTIVIMTYILVTRR